MQRGHAIAGKTLRAALVAAVLASGLASDLASGTLAPRTARAEPPDAKAPPSPDEARRKLVIAHGDGVEVTIGEVEDVLAQQGPSLRARYRDPEQLKVLVNGLVRAELLAIDPSLRDDEDVLDSHIIAWCERRPSDAIVPALSANHTVTVSPATGSARGAQEPRLLQPSSNVARVFPVSTRIVLRQHSSSNLS